MCILGSSYVLAVRVETQVFLHTGLILCPDSDQIPGYSLSRQNQYVQKQEAIRVRPGDTLALEVFNADSLTHTLGWQLKNGPGITISPGTSEEILYVALNEGMDYLVDVSDGSWRYLGLHLPLFILAEGKKAFIWTVSEKSAPFSRQLMSGLGVDFDSYDPEYFFINGLANPQTLTDSLARVEGNVGDSIHIFIFNTGMAAHSLHFHGYHAEILYSSAYPGHQGRSKDTFPVLRGEVLHLLLIPDKPGEYPVHDHNLIAVSGGGIYPNGMFTTLLIH